MVAKIDNAVVLKSCLISPGTTFITTFKSLEDAEVS